MDSMDPSAPPQPPPSNMPSRVRGPSKNQNKAARVTFSCAECRRLKLKCSRQPWPCTKCVERGCSTICPERELRGHQNKLVIKGTEELHDRIQLLELALKAAHAKTSKDEHALLRDVESVKTPSADGDDLGAFGTLTIGTEGEARYVGPNAGSQYLQEDDDEEGGNGAVGGVGDGGGIVGVDLGGLGGSGSGRHHGRNASPPLGGDRPSGRGAYADTGLSLLDSIFPAGSAFTVEELQKELPDWDAEGRALMTSYWDNVNWMYQVIPQGMFEADHFPNAYSLSPDVRPHAHKVACVFLMMALGAMFNLRGRPWDPRAQELFHRGRACLGLVGLEHASPATVQALHLVGTFILNDRIGNGADVFWPILGVATRVAQSLGLHRDGSSFGLSPYEVEERRQVYWEILTYDRLQAMCFGRPCALINRSCDTKFPQEPSWIPDEDGFHRAKYELMEMMEKVIDIQTTPGPVQYADVVQLDKAVCDFRKALPETLMPNVPIPDLPLDTMTSPHFVIHRFGIRLLVAQTRLLLNRHWVMRAILMNPDDPVMQRDGDDPAMFGGAFVASYESAQEIVQVVKQLVLYHPALIARWWFFWFHAFSAAVILAAVAIHAPTSAFAGPAFTGLSHVCTICEAAGKGFRAKSGLPFMKRLKQRAQEALSSVNHDDPEIANGLSHLSAAPKLVRVGGSGGGGGGGVGGTPPPQRSGSHASPSHNNNNNTPKSGGSDMSPLQHGQALPERSDEYGHHAHGAGGGGGGGHLGQQQHHPPPPLAPWQLHLDATLPGGAQTMDYSANWFNEVPSSWHDGFEYEAQAHAHAQQHGGERVAMDTDLSVAMGLEGVGAEGMGGVGPGGVDFGSFVSGFEGRGGYR